MPASWKACCSCIPQRWIITFLCFFGLLNAYSMRICLSVTITEMVKPSNQTEEIVDDTCSAFLDEELTSQNKTIVDNYLYDWDEYTQGIILSSFYWAYIATNLWGGAIALKIGGKHMLGLGILSTAILTLLTPATVTWGGPTALIWLRVIMGIGEGVTFPALSDLMAKWIPEDERSKAGSIVFSGAFLGTIFGMSGSGIIMQHSDIGWPMVFYFFGAVGCLSFALNCAFCYNNPSENPFITAEETKYLKKKLKHTSHYDLPSTPWKYVLQSKPVWALIIVTTGSAWGFLTMISDMPKYMSSVLRFSVENNGYLSSIPYLAQWIVSSLVSVVADSFITNKRMTVEQVRKVGATISMMGPAIFLIAASYAGCNRILVVALITIGLAHTGCSTFSIMINALDLAPNYASSLMGLVNGIATLSGIGSPYVVGILTPNQTVSEWRLVFWIVFVIYVLTNLVYLIWGSGELQQWNDPAFLTKRREPSDEYAKENMISVNKFENY